MRRLGVATCVAALYEGEHRDQGHRQHADDRDRGDERQAGGCAGGRRRAPAPGRSAPATPGSAPPGRRGRSRSCPRRPAAGCGEPPAPRARRAPPRSGTPAYPARSGAAWAILAPDGVTSCRNSADAIACCAGVNVRHRALEVGRDDLGCAAEALERGRPQRGGALLPLHLPEPFHHELEVRRLDPLLACLLLHRPAAAETAADPPRRHLVENRLGERRLDLDRIASEPVPAGERLLNGRRPASRERRSRRR